MGAGGRALKQLEQQYRNTIADGLGRTASDPEVEVTVASHMAPMKKRMMAVIAMRKRCNITVIKWPQFWWKALWMMCHIPSNEWCWGIIQTGRHHATALCH